MDIQCLKGNKCCHWILALPLIVLTAYFGVLTYNKIQESKYIGQTAEQKNTFTISDTGEVYAKPDLAITTLSVISEQKTVAEAMSDSTKKMNAIVKSVKDSGVEDKDIKTVGFYISPVYEWQSEVKCVYYPCPEGKRILTGYEITQSLQVKIRDLEKIGDIIQGATDNGANQVGDLQFTIEKEDDLKKQAREGAINKVKDKAKILADQLGVKIVRIVSYSEGGGYNYPTAVYSEKAVSASGGDATPQIQTGENKIEATVSITYEFR
jgi:hypothetical protein